MLNKQGGLYRFGNIRSGGLQQSSHVFENLICLALQTDGQLSRLRNDGDLSRGVHQTVHDPGLGIGTDGRRGLIRLDNIHLKILLSLFQFNAKTTGTEGVDHGPAVLLAAYLTGDMHIGLVGIQSGV